MKSVKLEKEYVSWNLCCSEITPPNGCTSDSEMRMLGMVEVDHSLSCGAPVSAAAASIGWQSASVPAILMAMRLWWVSANTSWEDRISKLCHPRSPSIGWLAMAAGAGATSSEEVKRWSVADTSQGHQPSHSPAAAFWSPQVQKSFLCYFTSNLLPHHELHKMMRSSLSWATIPVYDQGRVSLYGLMVPACRHR